MTDRMTERFESPQAPTTAVGNGVGFGSSSNTLNQ